MENNKDKEKITFKKIKAYLTGNFRYKLYYSDYKFLIRTHIIEQIEARINSMQASCFFNGTCSMCGCMTTALQMANKACNKPCYPVMMNKEQWRLFKEGYSFPLKGVDYKDKANPSYWKYNLKENKFEVY